MERALLSTPGMGALFRLSCLGVLIAVAGEPRAAKEPALQSGDVVLQTSRSSRSLLIRRASSSPYSHTGVVEVAADGVWVLEAIQPVSRTPWRVWRARGAGGRVTVLRAKGLDAAALAKVVAAAKRELGKPYDARYRWDDERLYCSELVAKAFARGAGLEVGRRERVDALALSAAELALAKTAGIAPDQELVTPGSLADDPAFAQIYSDFPR